jgi:hypothetical protein
MIAKQPFGRGRANMNLRMGARFTQRQDHLIGSNRVAVAMTGNIIKDCTQGGFDRMKLGSAG